MFAESSLIRETGKLRRLHGGFLNLAWDVSEPLRPLGFRM
jgi:hypothetical protein